MKTMKEYKKPEMEVIKMATVSIIAGSRDAGTSPGGSDWDNEEEGA